MNKVGLRQKVRSGDISPDEAIKLVNSNPTPSLKFLKWVNTTGRQRYASAMKSAKSEKKKKTDA
jgi:hypothetical protein